MNQGFSYYFCMMIEESGSGSIPLTSGSASGTWRPKNIWIRIRIRNTALQSIRSHKGNQSRIIRVAKKDYFFDGTALPEVSV
jgi:hypothetical protein